MSGKFWYMVEVYRKHEIPETEYKEFRSEVRKALLATTQLSLNELVYDSQLYPDTRELSDPVMDVRVLYESDLPKVREILDSAKHLRYEIKRKRFRE